MAKTSDLDHFKASLISPLPVSESKYLVENLFTYKLSVSPKEIWPFLSDTSKMNKEMGFPPRLEKEINGENHVSTKTLGREEKWIEKPWVWVEEKELQNYRVFQQGWMTEQRGVFAVKPLADGCEVAIYFRWGFSNIFSKILFAMIGPVLGKNFEKFFQSKVEVIKGSRSESNEAPVLLSEPESPYETMLNYFKTADDLDLDRIHLKKLALQLNLPLDMMLEISQRMVNEGLMTLSWDVVCPHCRGVRAENAGLAFIKNMNSCEACDIEFSLDSEDSIEVVFHLTNKLRDVKKFVYCAAEPSKKKHIKISQLLNPKEDRTIDMDLSPGTYRLRTKKSGTSTYIDVEKNSPKASANWKGNPERLNVKPQFELSFENAAETEDMVTLEEAWWFQDRLLPREVLSNASMRSLFSEDHLKVGVKLNVGNQIILFTDIVGSTPFYKSYGDVRALKVVQDHYDEVTAIIQKYRGVVVKYIGDAVMAAFTDIDAAFNASMEIHRCFHQDRADTPVRLRVSFHAGPVLCANMNVGLDYFGTTVNQSAKIQKWAGAYEIAILEEDWELLKHQHPEIKAEAVHDEKLGVNVRIIKASGK